MGGENLDVIGSPGFESDHRGDTRGARRASYDRGYNPRGVGAASWRRSSASGDRTPSLARLDLPALVIHGEEDPLIDVSGGRATAAALPDAKLIVVPGMGHDLPRELWPRFVEEIAATARRAGASADAVSARDS